MASNHKRADNFDDLLRDALLEANRRDFEDILRSDEKVSFSSEYEKAMRRIIGNFERLRKASRNGAGPDEKDGNGEGCGTGGAVDDDAGGNGEDLVEDSDTRGTEKGTAFVTAGETRRKSGAGRLGALKMAACILLAVVLLGGGVLAISPNARAAVVRWAQQWHFFSAGEYIPVSEEDDFYGLRKPVSAEGAEGLLRVESAYVKNGKLSLALEGTIPIEDPLEKWISISDSEGAQGKYLSCDYMYDETDGSWNALIVMEFPRSDSDYLLTCSFADGPELSLRFDKAEDGDVLLAEDACGWYSDPENGVGLMLFSGESSGQFFVTILSETEEEGAEVSLPWDEICLLTKEGERIYPIRSDGAHSLYFSTAPERGDELEIPYLELFYPDQSGSVKLERGGAGDVTFSLGDKKLELSGVSWQSYQEELSPKTPEGETAEISQPAQRIGFSLTLKGASEKLALRGISAEAAENCRNRYRVGDMKFRWDDPFQSPDSSLFSVSGLKPDIDEAEIVFSSPVYRIKSPASISIR